jgi:hypothetical protein
MMVAVLAVAGLLAALNQSEIGFAFFFIALLVEIVTILVEPLVQGRRRLAAGSWITTVVLANISVGLVCIYAPGILGRVLTLMMIIFATPFALVLGAAWARMATAPDAVARRSPFFAWACVLILTALLPTMLTHWPFRLAFLASRPALDRLADQVEVGQVIRKPQLVGAFWIIDSRIDIGNGNVALITDDDPVGASGLVRLGSNNPTGSLGPIFNHSIDEALDARWRFQQED